MKKIVLFSAILLAFGILPMAASADAGDPEVIIPHKAYERSGFGHGDYEGSIRLKDRCPPYHGLRPGDFFEIPILLSEFEPEIDIGGFQLELEFDYLELNFYGAMRGALLENRVWEMGVPPGDSTFWSWEYFSYRVFPCPLCDCCKYKILLCGQAEMPNGDLRRGYCLTTEHLTHPTYSTYWAVDSTSDTQEEVGATVAWLKFQIAHNYLLLDLTLRVFFEWEHTLDPDSTVIIEDWDCVENTMWSCDAGELYVSNDPLQYQPGVCPEGANIHAVLDFVTGGVHLCAGPMFECLRGDIDLNCIAYETADAVLFASYFVRGIIVFTVAPDYQVCGTDVNADGQTLVLTDLMYLIRIIQGDITTTYPSNLWSKPDPSTDVANLIVSDGRISVESASEIGGLLFEFDAAVTPSLLADMELLTNEGKVLVWSSEGNSISAGVSDVMTFAGAELVSVTAVDREGRDLETTITVKVAPSAFALYPAYPNPFNPCTNLSFTLADRMPYKLNIYNVAGQLVRSYDGMGVAGLNAITWDGKDNAGSDVSSGVYFFKVMAGPHKAAAKMVLMK